MNAPTDPKPIPGVRAIMGNTKPPSELWRTLIVTLAFAPVFGLMVFYVQRSPKTAYQLLYTLPLYGILWSGLFVYQNKRFRNQNSLRFDRLRRIAALPDVAKRLPHRLLELRIMEAISSFRRIRLKTLNLPPGPAIVVERRPSELWLADPAPILSEPLELTSDAEQVVARWFERGGSVDQFRADTQIKAMLQELATNIQESTGDPQTIENRPARKRFSLLQITAMIVAGVGLIALFGFWIQQIIFYSANRRLMAAPIALFGAIAVAAIAHVFKRRSLWLLPGMVVVVQRPLVIGQSKITKYTPQNGRLIMGRWVGTSIFSNGRLVRLLDLRIASLLHPSLALYWSSIANQPSPDEIESFLGDDP